MDAGGGSAGAANNAGPMLVEVGQSFLTHQALRSSIANELSFTGHGIRGSKNCGGRQKGYTCSE